MRVKNLISLIVIIAFVATTMPSLAHATMIMDAAVRVINTQDAQKSRVHEDCHHGVKKALDGQNDVTKETADASQKKPCCDKNYKCVDGFCSGPLSILGFHDLIILSPYIGKNRPVSADETIVSDLFSQIKRPPRL